MDTGTHLVFGLGLGGLAMLDPAFSSRPDVMAVVLVATVAGSNAPDLDTLLRLRSNTLYIKHHRGWSHSIPAWFAWTGLITSALLVLNPSLPWRHLAFWVLLSVVVHVLTDLFNSFGAQALLPFSRKWVKWNVIHIFDPFIFSSHILAVFMWAAKIAEPRVIFPVLYGLLVLYYAWRTLVHARAERKVPEADPHRQPGDRYTVLPTMAPYRWNVIRSSEGGRYGVGEWERGRLRWEDAPACDDHPAADVSKRLPDIQAFLARTPFPCAKVKPHSWGYEVRWQDIRYRYRRQYPFVAVVLMDFSFAPLQSYVGWLSDDRLEKRLRINTY
ncbi:metal-dependent hydrolase [Cohnella caldifontis]|uniref:metal-dependent hydrolase n=1 Tax=Cohnella caldifontis TaxID=3027471 RepID=UPI0023ECEA07|nr:metal-dependent hydrolase [Cohnella sp. YIM B05605]